MYEIRVRYIHHEGDLKNWQVTFDSGPPENILTMAVSEGLNTSVVEVVDNSIVTQLRLKNISHNFVGPSFFDDYPYIQILQVDCPIPSISWIFRKLPAFKFLSQFHLTKEAFRESIEGIPSHKTWMTCPNLHTFQAEYDPVLYAESEPMDRKRMEIRLTSALRFGQIMFPNLKQCRILVPFELERTLDGFIDSYPNVRLSGEKLIRYADGSVCFSNLDCDLTMSTQTQTQRRASAPPGDATSATSYTDGYNRWLQDARSKERLLTPVPLADAPFRTNSTSALDVGSDSPRKASMPLHFCNTNPFRTVPGASQLAVRPSTPTVRITTLL